MPDILEPERLIKEVSVSKFCETADIPFREVTDPVPLMAKPFGNMVETPDILFNLGHVLSGLQLGRTMQVVDFGAGTCWLSRCLNQLGCATISVDPSASALEIGRRLMKEHPPIGGCVKDPVFLLYDGHRIDLADGSVDRVICFDSFHHVPNQAEVLAEFFRVLKPGGIAAFSEPGRHHSRTEQAQHEMRTWGVLENDIILEDIRDKAFKAGFADMVIKLALNPHIALPYRRHLMSTSRNPVKKFARMLLSSASTLKLYYNLLQAVDARSIFTLHKGAFVPDSRLSHVARGGGAEAGAARDLQYVMTADRLDINARPGDKITLSVKVANTGSVIWLHDNIVDYAVVKLGGHLYDGSKRLLNLDFLRSTFQADVAPGCEAGNTFSFSIDKPGQYKLMLDLVSERITWFEASGSKPVCLNITIA